MCFVWFPSLQTCWKNPASPSSKLESVTIISSTSSYPTSSRNTLVSTLRLSFLPDTLVFGADAHGCISPLIRAVGQNRDRLVLLPSCHRLVTLVFPEYLSLHEPLYLILNPVWSTLIQSSLNQSSLNQSSVTQFSLTQFSFLSNPVFNQSIETLSRVLRCLLSKPNHNQTKNSYILIQPTQPTPCIHGPVVLFTPIPTPETRELHSWFSGSSRTPGFLFPCRCLANRTSAMILNYRPTGKITCDIPTTRSGKKLPYILPSPLQPVSWIWG